MEISFGGCGFLGVYHVGVGKCFEDNARHLLKQFKGYYGASAGAICAAAAACHCDSMDAYKFVKKTVEAARVYRLGLLNPRFDLYARVREFLDSYLPKDAHKRSRGKVHISMTLFPEMKNYIVSDFTTRKELINAIVCSSFIPGYAGFKNLPKFRGKAVCDGGFSSNIPSLKDPNVISVSPFSGGCDICPQGESSVLTVVHPVDQPFLVSMENMSRVMNSLCPSSWDYLEKLFHQGYQDTLRFLLVEGHVKPAIPLTRPCSTDVQSVDSGVETCVPTDEERSEYFSVDGDILVPPPPPPQVPQSRTHSFALSTGYEFLSCVDEEDDVRSCLEEEDEGVAVGEVEGVDSREGWSMELPVRTPSHSRRRWFDWKRCFTLPVTCTGKKVIQLVSSVLDRSPHPLEQSWDGDHSTPALLHTILTNWPGSMAMF